MPPKITESPMHKEPLIFRADEPLPNKIDYEPKDLESFYSYRITPKPSIWDWLKSIPSFIRILINLFIDVKMKKDMKTTITGIVKAIIAVLGIILGFFGIGLPAGTEEIVLAAAVAIYALVDLIQAIFTKDKEPKEV